MHRATSKIHPNYFCTYETTIRHLKNIRIEHEELGKVVQLPVVEQPQQDSLTGATGLKANISQLLRWGVAHLPDQVVGGRVLREAIEMTGQVKI